MKSFDAYLQLKQRRMDNLRAQLQSLLGDRTRFTLEIGCGHGDYLNAYGAAYPDEFCLGIDIISRRVFKSCNKKQRADLNNVHFLKAEALECLACLPAEAKAGKVLILFPDPWPKNRHHKHRLIQPSFLDTLAHACTPEARIYFRTDHLDYFAWTRSIIAGHALWQEDSSTPWPLEAVTYFQKIMGPHQSLVAARTNVVPSPTLP